jgi:probable RNA-binding protein EIF1AD
MGPPRRKLQATVEETITPPDSLGNGQLIARIVKAEGKNLYTVRSPSSETLLVELEARFRSTIWLKRGSYVLIDKNSLAERDNKIDGEIVNVVRDEKAWRKEKYWPKNFVKQKVAQDSDEEESTVGKMPPVESGEEDETEE